MGELCDTAHMIQRVIDTKYPNTRLVWQSLQAPGEGEGDWDSRGAIGGRAPPGAALRPVMRAGPPEQLDRVVQRVIDNRYPEARLVWRGTRGDCAWTQPAGLRSRSLGAGLPALGRTTDPRWANRTFPVTV
jgi:hypothetical protein